MIDSINIMMLQDSKDASYIPFKNGVAKISKNKVELKSYIDVDGYIWENQIIERDFTLLDDCTNDFQDFVSKVSADDRGRINALETTLGYLMHTFKDKTDQKAIIFNDQEIDDNPNGGSGKSLMLAALGNLRRVVKIDGKSFNPSKSDSYTLGYVNQMLLNTLAENVSEQVFKDAMEMLRATTVKNFVKG